MLFGRPGQFFSSTDRLLIALEGQHMIGIGLDDLFGDGVLAARGADGRMERANSSTRNRCGRPVNSLLLSATVSWPGTGLNSHACLPS